MKTTNKHIKKGVGGVIYDVVIYGMLILLCFSIIYVIWYLISLSFSGYGSSLATVTFWPRNFTLENYRLAFGYRFIPIGYFNTIKRMLLGVAIEVTLCVLTAYPLSHKELPMRNFFTAMIVLTMFIGCGLIPFYIHMKDLGLMDTIWSLVLPGAIPTYSMLLTRNYIMSVPTALEESAKIDGANDFIILIRIIVPVITPIIACLCMWGIVGHWSAWFDSMLYIHDADRQVLQIVVRNMTTVGGEADRAKLDDTMPPEAFKAAVIFVSIVPVLILYPFFQKYFTKGMLVGSLKG